MIPENKRSPDEELDTRIQIIVIIVAAIWTVYTLARQEINVLKTAPTDIHTGLELEKSGYCERKTAFSLLANEVEVDVFLSYSRLPLSQQ